MTGAIVVPTLEQLENDVWPEPKPEEATRLVTTCHRLRRKDIDDFSTEDLRVMLGQGIGLPHLAPLAIAILEDNPLIEGDLYPGDLLTALIRERNYAALEPWTQRLLPICRAAAERMDPFTARSDLMDALHFYIKRHFRSH
jgi:hypothetical protein